MQSNNNKSLYYAMQLQEEFGVAFSCENEWSGASGKLIAPLDKKNLDQKDLTKGSSIIKTPVNVLQSKSEGFKTQTVKQSPIDSIASFDELKLLVENSNLCEIKALSHSTVFSDGIRNAPVMLIGEAPGETEDLQGIPFCGKSGQLLRTAIKTIGLNSLNNLYITNTVFWRPPANRKPTPEEILACLPVVHKQIALGKPKLLILCGAVAVEAITGNGSVGQVIGKFATHKNPYMERDCLYTAIYHPAYLLRNPSAKKDFWFSLLRIKDKLNEIMAV